MRPKGVVILAAGESKRMGGVRSKVTLPLLGKPVIKYIVDSVKAMKPEKIAVVVGKDKEKVMEILKNDGVLFVEQKERNGTAGALLAARRIFGKEKGWLLTLMGDTPLLRKDTLREILRFDGDCLVVSTTLENPQSYGRIIKDSKGEFIAIKEERELKGPQKLIKEINTGVYVFKIPELWKYLKEVKPSTNGELYLTHVPQMMKEDGLRVEVKEMKNMEEFLGINTPEDFARCEEMMRNRKIGELLKKGVIIPSPLSVWISEEAIVQRGTILYPYTFILGKTKIGQKCEIGPCVYISNSIIKNNCRILFSSHIESSKIGENSQIGPFARLRPETRTGKNVRIGNFVELKKTFIDEGSKANHLAYLGDATIGKNVNVGAGVITCNYDGIKKHRTIIGSEAFVGSDVQLVAPVRIGRRAYIGAGSTITKDVPDEALGIARSPQKNIPGYYQKKRKGN